MKKNKKTCRLDREECLQVRTKRRKKLAQPIIPMQIPGRLSERWSMDSVSDQLASARRIRIFNVVDDYSRECVDQVVDVPTTLHSAWQADPECLRRRLQWKIQRSMLETELVSGSRGARRALDELRAHYNKVRPHRSLGQLPALFARMAG